MDLYMSFTYWMYRHAFGIVIACRHSNHSGKRSAPDQDSSCTLFVGDLPEFGFANDDLTSLFSVYGCVKKARVMGTQCFGFVEFDTHQQAVAALEAICEGTSMRKGFS